LFNHNKIRDKSVLIIEINNFHGITLPGYIHYFAELGYNVDVFLLLGQNVLWRPLDRLEDEFRAFYGDEQSLSEKIRSTNLKSYDFVFINTTFYYGIYSPYPNAMSVFDLIGIKPKGKFGTLMIEHNYDPFVEKFNEQQYIKEGTLFTLLGFRNTKMLSSSYVGKVTITPKNKNKIIFLAVGTLAPQNRNYKMLIEACESLIKQKIINFKINIIGYGNLEDLPKEVQPFINILGALSYPDMFETIEHGDYILTLFDPDNKEHHKYVDNWASGSSILFYAFSKLPLIHSFFAQSYFLDNNNAIVYTNLEEGMKSAIEIGSTEYQCRQEALTQLAKNLQIQSIKNLSEQLERMKNVFSSK